VNEARSLRILVVEDEPSIRRGLCDVLTFRGYKVESADNGRRGLEQLTSTSFDLVLLDVMLPDADGFDILYKMRQHPALSAVPVIMMTGKATREAVIKGLAGGADGYVTKPFEADALLEAVRTVLGLPQEAPPAGGTDPWSGKAR
jgi:two-component system OmpR family response regulator